jgi:hypothetical protein
VKRVARLFRCGPGLDKPFASEPSTVFAVYRLLAPRIPQTSERLLIFLANHKPEVMLVIHG